MMKRTVVLLGRLGHGKTCLFNKLCGTSHFSAMTAGSCTREVVEGCTLRRKVTIIDTPGFSSSDATDSHIKAQRRALESQELSGIILVVKYGTASDMANCLNHIMDFVGTDNVCIIVTHAEVVLRDEQQSDDILIRASLSSLLGVASWKILLVGKDTKSSCVEDFVVSRLSPPMRIQIDPVQLQFASTLTVGARRFNVDIEKAKSKTDVALQSCQALFTSFEDDKVVRDLVMRVRDETARHVDEILRRLILEANSLSPEVQKSLRSLAEETLLPSLEALKRLEVSPLASPHPAVKAASHRNRPLNEVLSTSQRSRNDEAQDRADSLSSPKRSLAAPVPVGSRRDGPTSHGNRSLNEALSTSQRSRNDEAQDRVSMSRPKRSLAAPVPVGSRRDAPRCPGTFVSQAVQRFESPATSYREFHFDCHSPTDDVQVANANWKLGDSASPRQGSRLRTSKLISADLPTKVVHDPVVCRSLSSKNPHVPGKDYNCKCREKRHAELEEKHEIVQDKTSPFPPWTERAPHYNLDDWEIIVSRHRVTTPTATFPNPGDPTTRALDVFLSDGRRRGNGAPYGPHPEDDCDSISL
jgi:small GTP-binding protein